MTRRALLAAVLLAAALAGPASAANRAPVCHGMTLAVAPDGAREFSVRCDDYDGPEAARVAILDAPGHGDADAVAQVRLRYEPDAGYTGPDALTFVATDGAGESPPVTQQLVVTDQNLAPRCLPLHVVTIVDSSHDAPRPCYDPNAGDAVRPLLASPPAHGTVFIGPDSTSYAPDSGFAGDDSFALKATDGTLEGPATTVTVDATTLEPPECDAPPTQQVRPGQTHRFEPTCRDNQQRFPYERFSYGLVDEPAHGQVDIDYRGNSVEYTSNDGYEGPDQYTLRVYNTFGPDQAGSSILVTVPVDVSPDANAAPLCQPVELLRVRTGASALTGGWCGDPDGDQLAVTVSTQPSHGAIAPATPNSDRSYTADDDYTGDDAFAISWSDGRADPVTLLRRVRVVGDDENTAPECPGALPRVRRGGITTITLSCTDAERDGLTYSWEEPEHGDVEKIDFVGPFAGTYLRYTPAADYVGPDRFRYRAHDGRGHSAWATVLVEVVPPSPPRCSDPEVRGVRPGDNLDLLYFCEAEMGSSVAPAVEVGPEHGSVEDLGGGHHRYTPEAGYEGPDSITFRAENESGADEFVQEIDVDPDANAVPRCYVDSGPSWTRGEPATYVLECYDPDGDPVTLSIVDQPEHGDLGALDQAEREIVYTPDPGFVGLDRFTFRGNDGRGDSTLAGKTIRVRAPDANYAPRCATGGVGTAAGQPVSFTPICTDGDGDALTVTVAEQPGHGTVTGPDGGGKFTYTPDPGFEGTDLVGIRASDSQSTSPLRQYYITVGSGAGSPGLPRCTPIAANVRHATSRRVQLRCSGPFGEPIDPELLTSPAHGTLGALGDDGWLTYTPETGFAGTDSFTFTAQANGKSAPPATVELRVAAAPPGGDDTPQEQPPGDASPPPPPPSGGPPPQPGPLPPPRDLLQEAVDRSLGRHARALGIRLGRARTFYVDETGVIRAPVQAIYALVCPVSCEIVARQRIVLSLGRARAAAAKPIRLRPQRLKLRPLQVGLVKLRLTKAQRRRLRRARRVTLVTSLTVTEAGGQPTRATTRLRLKVR